jgi:hypothetical protein
VKRTPLPFQFQRPWVSRTTLSLLLSTLFFGFAVAPSYAVAVNSMVTAPGIVRSIQTGPRSNSKTTVTDIPVADTARFSPPRRGCNFLPASATYAGTSSSTKTTVASHAPLALGRCRVLEIGDSLGDDLGFGLYKELGKTHGLTLLVKDKTSTGLSASWSYNWPQHFANFLSEYHPNLVVVVFGANDEQALNVHGVSQPFGSPGWRVAYEARVRRIDRMATKAGSYVLWVGLPIVQPNGYRQGLNALDAIYQQVTTSIPGVTFQPSWSLFATKGGDYRGGAMVNHQSDGLRLSDGIHFNSTGELVWGTFVARQLASIYNVKIRPRSPMTIDG